MPTKKKKLIKRKRRKTLDQYLLSKTKKNKPTQQQLLDGLSVIIKAFEVLADKYNERSFFEIFLKYLPDVIAGKELKSDRQASKNKNQD